MKTTTFAGSLFVIVFTATTFAQAGDDEEKEVRTREVLEDDVPDEYLNQD